jgi:hypothetical protein
MQFSISYVLANSRSWGGQPVASYSGNGIAIDPDNQFKDEEWGPTRIDERHRFVLSGVFDLPLRVQAAPVVQWASPRSWTSCPSRPSWLIVVSSARGSSTSFSSVYSQNCGVSSRVSVISSPRR